MMLYHRVINDVEVLENQAMFLGRYSRSLTKHHVTMQMKVFADACHSKHYCH